MTNLGPYEVNSIHAGDCAVLMRDLPDGCIDLTVTSPPYDNLRTYNGYHFDFEAIAAQLWRVTKPGGVVVWVVADQTIDGSETGTSFKQALHFMALGFNLHDTMIYRTSKPPLTHNRYEQEFEYMFVLSRGAPRAFNGIKTKSKHAGKRTASTYRDIGNAILRPKNGSNVIGAMKVRGNVWTIGSGKSQSTLDDYAFVHPAMFPEVLARDHILSWSNPGDIVFDPMCGSGTTPKMAHETGRRFLAFDISTEYVELARRRVQYARTPLPLFQEE